jgi:hypothetical protein
MKLEDVTVLNVDGSLLAYGADSVEKSPDNLLALEKEVSQLAGVIQTCGFDPDRQQGG